MLNSGARGYILKGASPEELVRAIETVEGGGHDRPRRGAAACSTLIGHRSTETGAWLRCVRSSFDHRDGGNYRTCLL